MGVFGHTGTFGLESVLGMSGVVDNAELAVLVEETVAALDVSVLVTLLITELPVVSKGKKMVLDGESMNMLVIR